MESKDPILCYFTLHGINYKNGFVTSCPQNPDQLISMTQSIKPSEIFNSKGFVQHRLEMMNGQWSRGCHLCKEPEAIGSKSMRQDYEAESDLYNFNDTTIDGKLYSAGTSKLSGLKHIELRFSNSCNMACRHCSTVYSSGWVSKLKHYVPDEEVKFYDLKQLLRTEHRESDDDTGELEITLDQVKEIVHDLCENALNIRRVEFAGGEVLNQKQFFYFLELLKEHPAANEIVISFHSNFNANFDPKKLHDLLIPFKQAIIHVSVDAGTNIYPYFRTGDWAKLENNIKIFREYNNTAVFVAVITTSAYQIMDLQNIFYSLLQLDFYSIDASMVYSPIYLNPSLMNQKFRDYILNDLDETAKILEKETFNRLKRNENTTRRSYNSGCAELFTDIHMAKRALNDIKVYTLNTNLESYAKSLGHNDLSYERILDAFQTYIRKTDKIWGQDFNEYYVNYKFNNGKIERV